MIGRWESSLMGSNRALGLLTLALLYLAFQLAEGWTFRRVQHFATELDRNLRRVTVQAREQRDLDALEHLARLVELVLEQRRERTDETVRQQDTEERAHQSGGDQLAELRGRQSDRLHRVNHAHDCR